MNYSIQNNLKTLFHMNMIRLDTAGTANQLIDALCMGAKEEDCTTGK